MQYIDLSIQQKRIRSEIDLRIQTVLNHGQYIMGPEVAELEEKLADYVGVNHCIGVSSGTDALLIALMALDIHPSDEIITTPFTFIATGEMIRLLGAIPVFVDIDPRTYNIDPLGIEAAVTPKTRAIMPVSLYGQCADLDAVIAIAAKHDLPVIEDGAQSFGATQNGKLSCGLTTIGCTSFFPSKPLGGYGDSGACFTNDDALAKRMREIRVHGQDKRYHHPNIGINGRMDTLQAAILLSKLELFAEEVHLRHELGARYTSLLSSNDSTGITVPWIAPNNTSVYAQYTILVNNRAAIQSALKEEDIPTAVHYPVPLYRQPAFADLNLNANDFPHVEDICNSVVSLPMHPYLTEDEQIKITQAVLSASSSNESVLREIAP